MNSDERSLLIIQSGEASLFSAVLQFVSEWCDGHGLKAYVRNTSDGGYEIFALPHDVCGCGRTKPVVWDRCAWCVHESRAGETLQVTDALSDPRQ